MRSDFLEFQKMKIIVTRQRIVSGTGFGTVLLRGAIGFLTSQPVLVTLPQPGAVL